ncbi:tRNA (adenosine(37)-N6)-threonylcarbamoyltransferase complex dimerization subunit type 1 TsaB [Clostridium malenominatum]|uniref:tRNA (Adenosine(37)-N6)-threonylcarbamoyltransferase complex dimerization subunit type 1 TsaB n=1 Tax=Clostridium malenominatum TaxID=1539 RepID=A0ABN1IN50_9CLOT
MKILSLDSATESATCAILEDDKLLGEVVFNYTKQHSIVLMNIIDYLLTNLNLKLSDLDGFAVSKGPGSFTGLRIGAATIKGLSAGSNKPFVSVSTLDSLAFNMAYTDGIICPVLDALRDNVYTSIYKFNGEKLERLIDYSAISIEELIGILNSYDEKITFVGEIEKFKEKLKTSVNDSYFAPNFLNVAKASSLGKLGMELIKSEHWEDINTFAPIYLRKSQAEREYENKHGV